MQRALPRENPNYTAPHPPDKTHLTTPHRPPHLPYLPPSARIRAMPTYSYVAMVALAVLVVIYLILKKKGKV